MPIFTLSSILLLQIVDRSCGDQSSRLGANARPCVNSRLRTGRKALSSKLGIRCVLFVRRQLYDQRNRRLHPQSETPFPRDQSPSSCRLLSLSTVQATTSARISNDIRLPHGKIPDGSQQINNGRSRQSQHFDVANEVSLNVLSHRVRRRSRRESTLRHACNAG